MFTYVNSEGDSNRNEEKQDGTKKLSKDWKEFYVINDCGEREINIKYRLKISEDTVFPISMGKKIRKWEKNIRIEL